MVDSFHISRDGWSILREDLKSWWFRAQTDPGSLYLGRETMLPWLHPLYMVDNFVWTSFSPRYFSPKELSIRRNFWGVWVIRFSIPYFLLASLLSFLTSLFLSFLYLSLFILPIYPSGLPSSYRLLLVRVRSDYTPNTRRAAYLQSISPCFPNEHFTDCHLLQITQEARFIINDMSTPLPSFHLPPVFHVAICFLCRPMDE